MLSSPEQGVPVEGGVDREQAVTVAGARVRAASTPAEPLLALTLRYASQTTRLEISNGLTCDFDSLTWLLPSTSVDHQTNPDNPPPSLQPHYRTFIASTRRSAPLPRIGTLPLAVSAAWSSPSRRPHQHAIEHIEASGSQVPHRSLNRARATSAPDTTWPGIQEPARLIPGQQLDPGFGCHRYAFDVSSVVHSRSPSRLAPDAITDAFSATLTTPAHSPTQLAVVCDLPLRGRSRRAHLHHRCSTASKIPSSTPEPPAFLAHRHPRNARTQPPDIPGPSTNRKYSAGTD